MKQDPSLRTRLVAHVGREERELFPLVENTIPGAQLAAAREALDLLAHPGHA